ncbi:MAG: DNA cytosine methyltransferase [Oscillospiraceae bacterium]|nr:DNA cytosine methyltransferase [Oscillospiraceae bacterium]
MLKDKTLTYISLFSSAGVGCYGFKQEGYQCIATNELLDRRMAVQRANHKCTHESGYITGDISEAEVKERVYEEIKKWSKAGNDRVDVLIATPPCQGISVINHKKNSSDINRNSLVVESIELIKNIVPRFFIFENVMAFQKTLCITPDGDAVPIGDYIRAELGDKYIITGRIMNFMNYGSNSSRTRTVVIGVDKTYRNNIVPYDLYPSFRAEKTLRDVIYHFPQLEWGEICKNDFYHAFRTYSERMRPWIHDLKECESAFDNEDPAKRPHQIKNGQIVYNVRKNRDKYTRQPWDRFVQCVHTRNDQLAAQNTIHPEQDRVFSIREIMAMMTIPHDFKWINYDLDELNAMPEGEKRKLYKEHEVNIRQCLGEAVPTEIMRQIAHNIKNSLMNYKGDSSNINKVIIENKLDIPANLFQFLSCNPLHLDISSLMRIAELCNAKREENAAFYTNKFIVNEIVEKLPTFSKSEIRILEPSVGVGSFIPFLFRKYENIPHVTLDVVDIDAQSIEYLKILLSKIGIPANFSINYICGDFLTTNFPYRYDLAIGNPPFSKIKSNNPNRGKIISQNANKRTNNLSEFFLERCVQISDYVSLVLNKTLLSTDEFAETREWLRNKKIERILDFGRHGFTGISIETMCLIIASKQKPEYTIVYNMKYNRHYKQEQKYITDNYFPYFIIYRDQHFDKIASKLQFGVFDVFRDRQITKAITTTEQRCRDYWVIKARNINDDGSGITHIPGYDVFLNANKAEKLTAFQFVNNENVYLTPNMTYNPRVIENLPNVIVDGSVAILIPKVPLKLTQKQMRYFSSDEYRHFYGIARNLSTQSINVDKTSVFFYGVLKDD